MSKRSSKSKRRCKVLGIAGVSLALASGASASTGEATTNIPSTLQSLEIFLGDEEISDVSLATFNVFDKENTAQKLRLARCGRGCGRGHGCGAGGGCGGCGSGGGGGVDGYP
jgi:hypothetical protein